MEIDTVKQWIQSGLPDAEIKIEGDSRHFEVAVISPSFAGKNLIQRHRMILDTVQSQIQNGELHALSIKSAKTPQEADSMLK